MKLSTALIGLFGLFAPSIKADGNLFDQDQDPSPITATAGLIEWDNSVEKEGSGHQGIIGGDHIERGSRPWLVPVRGRYFCGGSLISPSAVMTAAHCVVTREDDEWHPPKWVDINRWSWYDNTGVKRLYIKDRSQCDGDVVYHPYYNETNNWDNDVAIIFLPEPVTDVVPVQLNENSKVPKAKETLDASGWGRYDAKIPYINWKAAAVNLTYVGDNEVCTHKPYRWKEDQVLDSMMCAIGEGDEPKSTCGGDSGGPLTLLEPNGEPSNTQVGIVSWGVLGCYHQSLPSVFTRVSEVADWVKETVCTRKGELCKGGTKSAKAKVMKTKYPDTCVPVGTDAPTTPYPSYSPTVTPQPITPYPTDSPIVSPYPTIITPEPTTFLEGYEFPTWMPTQSGKARKE
ncbi:hypothetical protein ACHAXN_003454 [Cyclotella atomus]